MSTGLFSLPTELRLHIYACVLAPTGTLSLSSTEDKRYTVTPRVTTALLHTCRRVYAEAVPILYGDNTVCFSIDCHDTVWPVINPRRLPDHALRQIRHLTLVCDCTSQLYFAIKSTDVDFSPLQSLLALRSLRICVVVLRIGLTRRLQMYTPAKGREMLQAILMRVPKTTEIKFGLPLLGIQGPQSDVARNMVQSVLERRRKTMHVSSHTADVDEYSVDGEKLRLAAASIPVDARGSLLRPEDEIELRQ